ncbi:MAG TPA: RNA 2',3'-cyclic phosphodiesterase [Pyrinomonadaceae bacterium]|nr:RNA 2',3'-cyclic phosphodiesterase [Pyrinomonadaceae bacterium]
MERNAYRTFIALEIPAGLRAAVIDHIKDLREKVPGASASCSREDNLHLTLKFLGDVPIARIGDVSAAASAAARASGPLELILAGAGVFPTRGKPSVLWIGIEDSCGLYKLQQRLEDECAARGFTRDARAYHPHLTIGRIRKPHGAKDLAAAHLASDYAAQTFTAKELVVFRSELLPQGSRHTSISSHALSGNID